MAETKTWWVGRPGERYWLESTDREDLGFDLCAPLTDDAGNDNWRYTLFQHAQVGDLVFHYDKRIAAITSVSRIAGRPVDHPIVWAARGSYARERGAQPEEVPGYRMALESHRALASPLSLHELRHEASEIRLLHDGLVAQVGRPLYFPFELSNRPVRPLQGYAFKLPRAFVEAFPGLVEAVTSISDTPERAAVPLDPFRTAIIAIEEAAGGYRMGRFQENRSRRLGLKRVAKSIFGDRNQAPDWAFHYGGREEIQFNLGIDQFADGSPAFRVGLAFSFEPSRSLPDVTVLAPKVARFNNWVRENSDTLQHLTMWHWQGAERSEDYAPSAIPVDRVRANTFVFLGSRQPMSAIDAHEALRVMDFLYPLYEWVEGDPIYVDPAIPFLGFDDRLKLENGRTIDGGRWISASLPERTLNIYLRHAEIQRRLVDALKGEGCALVVAEAAIGQRSIDVVAQHAEELWFYEIKTAGTVRGCLRQAIGQLLEYALWPGSQKPARLVVVGEPPLDATSQAYLDALNNSFPIPLTYRQQCLVG